MNRRDFLRAAAAVATSGATGAQAQYDPFENGNRPPLREPSEQRHGDGWQRQPDYAIPQQRQIASWERAPVGDSLFPIGINLQYGVVISEQSGAAKVYVMRGDRKGWVPFDDSFYNELQRTPEHFQVRRNPAIINAVIARSGVGSGDANWLRNEAPALIENAVRGRANFERTTGYRGEPMWKTWPPQDRFSVVDVPAHAVPRRECTALDNKGLPFVVPCPN